MPAKPVQRRQADRLDKRIDRLSSVTTPDDESRISLRQLWENGRKPDAVKVRESFVRLPRTLGEEFNDSAPPPRDLVPPVARLISPRGAALRVALLAVFVAHCTRGTPAHLANLPVEPETTDQLGWRNLLAPVAAHGPGTVRATTVKDNRILQIKAALDRLAEPEVGLVKLPRAGTPRSKYVDIRLLNESGVRPIGEAPVYKLPLDRERVIEIPAAMFLNGWLNALEDSEIAAWLMFQTASQRTGRPIEGFAIDGDSRVQNYGLRRSVWDRHADLGTYGLMRHEADVRRREDGTVEDAAERGVGERHRFWMLDVGLDQPALPAVLAALSEARDEL